MWSLQNLLFTLCIASSQVISAAGLIRVSGYEGREAKVSCPYEEGYESYEKYLCRNECGDDDVLITTTRGKTDRYSIDDDKNKRVFTATISDLSSTDAGKYWCGVTRTGKDIYTEVKLDVKPDRCCDHFAKVQGYEDSSVSINCSYKSEDRNNLKYICRGNQPSTCLQQAVVTSDIKQNGQFSINDDKISSKFTVTITSLTQKDSGMYLCGVHRNTGLDVFSGVELEVKEWCCMKSHTVSGIVGLPVTMECPYSPQHRTNIKFLCRGDHRNDCTVMVTSQHSSDQTDHRFTLQDDAASSSFLVNITELKAGDTGTYWCGSDPQWSVGNYTKIQLSVVFPQQTSTVEQPVSSQVTQTSSRPITDAALPFHPVVFIVPTVLLALTFTLVVLYKYRCCKEQGINENRTTKTAEADDGMSEDNDYENQEVIVSSKQGTSKQQSAWHRGDEDAGEDQQDSVYQNFTTDDIYCNEVYVKANKK
ncbi:polymeric immunoglobulin receptor-like [Thunnus maccoyii]|uniref:polymeric immunoglobulin receptor-like n=1 Tax=Thunnus maccoyii TaxID=8240 RepID=UPI001C4C1FCF|nr:polymeric immunoglobulin receptor-like [Thunnus maccoyii]